MFFPQKSYQSNLVYTVSYNILVNGVHWCGLFLVLRTLRYKEVWCFVSHLPLHLECHSQVRKSLQRRSEHRTEFGHSWSLETAPSS